MPFSKVFLSNHRNVAHYIDDYRNEDKLIVLCRRKSTYNLPFIEICKDDSIEICRTCIKASEKYPTKEEFFEYHSCTDCGTDLWSIGQGCYKTVNSVWRLAYPEYKNEEVTPSRPCWNCLSQRIGRSLTDEDFTYIW